MINSWSLTRHFCIVALLELGVAAEAFCQDASIPFQGLSKAQRQAMNIIVMLRPPVPSGDPIGVGAGIIIGQDDCRIYIATAAHNLTIGEHIQARYLASVTVKFGPTDKFRPSDKWFKAQVIENFLVPDTGDFEDKPDLVDLAVVAVTRCDNAGFDESTWSFAWSFVASALTNHRTERKLPKPGDDVYSIGYARGQPWTTNTEPDSFARVTDTEIIFESGFIEKGQSGGGLFSQDMQLLGMVTGDERVQGRAIRVNVLKNEIVNTIRPSECLGIDEGNARNTTQCVWCLRQEGRGKAKFFVGAVTAGAVAFYVAKKNKAEDSFAAYQMSTDPSEIASLQITTESIRRQRNVAGSVTLASAGLFAYLIGRELLAGESIDRQTADARAIPKRKLTCELHLNPFDINPVVGLSVHWSF